MNNKITKKRLSEMLAYDWLKILAFAVGLIIIWQVIFSVFGVRISTGEQFKYFYDYGIDSSGNGTLQYIFAEDETFSAFMQKLESENLTSNDETFRARLAVQDADMIFTNITDVGGQNRANDIIDLVDYNVYDFDTLYSDAYAYLSTFLIEDGLDALDYNNLSEEKIENHFSVRLKGDNRFRSSEDKAQGIEWEKARIKKLCSELSIFGYLLEVGEEKGLFYTYTRFEQTSKIVDSSRKDYYEYLIQAEIDGGRQNAKYGIKMEALSGGEYTPQQIAKIETATEAKNVVLMAFNYLTYQPYMQFECIFFINSVVRACSNLI